MHYLLSWAIWAVLPAVLIAMDSSKLISSGRVTKQGLWSLPPLAWSFFTVFFGFIAIICYVVARSQALAAAPREPGQYDPANPPLGQDGKPIYQKPPMDPGRVILIVVGSIVMFWLLVAGFFIALFAGLFSSGAHF